jgi:pyruvate/2-oxoglutarate dehydrogenase complex dihydrolipoamide dehydrogenase (E3) component
MTQYDAIVIGTGQAGPAMANALAAQGRKVAIAEGYRFGGSCVNYGCRPTKVLIASAHAAHMARRGADFGVMIDGMHIDWARVSARVVGIIDHTSSDIEGWLRGLAGVDVFHAYARFEGKAGANTLVRMGDTVVEAPQVFINTGTRARIPDIPGIDTVEALDSEKLLRLDTLPEHLLIYGGSYIALEMGQAFRRLGSRVTIIETADHILQREDDDVQQIVHDMLTSEGITILTRSNISRAEKTATGGVRLVVRNGDGSEQVVEGTHWLNAVGRVPNTDKLNLESVGVQVDARGMVVVDEGLQTTAPGIYALGDINGKGAFTHTAYYDFEIVRDNLLFGQSRRVSERTMAYSLFTDPPLGRVGMSEKDARASGRKVLMAKRLMSSIGRAIEQAETTGFIKLLVDAESERILGATVLGYHGDDVVQAISYYMATGATYHAMRNALPIHPTIAEFLPTILSELAPLV